MLHRSPGVLRASLLLSLCVVGCAAAPLLARDAPAPARPELVLQLGHLHGPAALRFTPDGASLVSQGDSIYVWDARTGELRRSVGLEQGHGTPLALSPDATLALGGGDQLHLWDARTGELRHTLIPASNQVQLVAFALGGDSVLTAGGPYRRADLTLWDVRTGKPLWTEKEAGSRVTALAYAPNGQLLASAGDEGIEIRDVRTGAVRRTLASRTVGSMVFSPDSRALAVAQWPGNGAVQSSNLQLWDPAIGVMTAAHTVPQSVHSLAFQPDSHRVAIGARMGTVWLWDTRKPAEVALLFRSSHEQDHPALAVSPDGKTLAHSQVDGNIRLWNLEQAKPERTLARRLGGPLTSVAFTPDGANLAAGMTYSGGAWGRGGLMQWDISRGALARTLPAPAALRLPVAFRPGQGDLATGGAVVRLWERGSGKLRLKVEPNWVGEAVDVAYAPDGATLAVVGGTYGHWSVCLLDAETGALRHTLETTSAPLDAVAFSPDGAMVASQASEVDESRTSVVRIWEPKTGRVLRSMPAGFGVVRGLAFSPRGKVLAAAVTPYGDTPPEVILWDAATGALLRRWNSETQLEALAFSPDGNMLAMGGRDGAVMLWDPATGNRKRVLRGHTQGVRSIAYSPDGSRIASAGMEGALKVWNAAEGRLAATLQVLPPAREGEAAGWIAYTPEGQYDGSPNAAQYIRWRVDEQLFPASRFEATHHHPATIRAALGIAD